MKLAVSVGAILQHGGLGMTGLELFLQFELHFADFLAENVHFYRLLLLIMELTLETADLSFESRDFTEVTTTPNAAGSRTSQADFATLRAHHQLSVLHSEINY
jgi:hypothetical protein